LERRRMNYSRVMRSEYTWFGGVPGAGLHVDNEWGHVEIAL
jgi:hypothetical protein